MKEILLLGEKRGGRLAFAYVALSDEPPQHVRAVVAVGGLVKGFLGEEVAVAPAHTTVKKGGRRLLIHITVRSCHFGGAGGGGKVWPPAHLLLTSCSPPATMSKTGNPQSARETLRKRESKGNR